MRTHPLYVLTLTAIALLVTSCAHHRDVRPGADGHHRIIVRAPEERAAEQDALKQAQTYCKKHGKKSPAILEEKTEYEGSMDENQRKTIRNASKAAGVVGGSMGVFGGRKERNAGAVVGGAGAVGAIMTGDDAYVTQMTFLCQ